MNECISKLLDKLAGSFLDSTKSQDPFEKNNAGNGGAGALAILYVILLIGIPFPYRLYVIAWPLMGLAVLYWRLSREAREYQSDVWTEFLVGWKVWNDLVFGFICWPIDVLFIIFGDVNTFSFRSKIRSIYIEDLFRKAGRTDHAFHSAHRMFDNTVTDAAKQAEQLNEIPETLVVRARVTGACGATIMTMASASVSAAGPTPSTTTSNGTNPVSISASGWITITGTIPENGKPETALEYAREFITVTDTALHAGLFTEVDVDAFQTVHNPDVLKRYYLTLDLGNHTSVNIGRMFVAGGWMLPGPRALETVNYPRYPFTFQGYAVQLDTVSGPWHILADVSGTTGLSFMNRNQFGSVETSAHIARSFGSQYGAALTWQLGYRFDRISIDGSAHPVSWLDMRSMVYYDREVQATSIGAYSYAGIRPLRTLPGFSLHGQTDYEGRLGGIETEPLILTGGLQMKFRDGKYSVIMDYQVGFGSRHAGEANGLLCCFQMKF